MAIFETLGKLAAQIPATPVLQEHVSLLRDQVTFLVQQLEECRARKGELAAENAHLKAEITDLKAQAKVDQRRLEALQQQRPPQRIVPADGFGDVGF